MTWSEILSLFTHPLFQLGQTWISLASIIQFIVVTGLIIAFSRLVRRLVRTRILKHTKLDVGLQYAIARITSYVVLVLGFVIGLDTIGVELRSFTVIAGALGVGIGFGLQNIVSNFVSGLIILAERPIQVGDRVDASGTLGQVVRIGARATHVLTNDNIMIIVPNAEFVTSRVVNWTHVDPRVRFRVPVGVGYGSDVRLVEKLLLQVAVANPHVLKDPAPTVVFKEFGDNSLNFEVRVWSADMSRHPGTLESELNFAIWETFKQHKIELPFPQRDIHVREPVRVEIVPDKK
jgi:small-conductance mechanosensitive channel